MKETKKNVFKNKLFQKHIKHHLNDKGLSCSNLKCLHSKLDETPWDETAAGKETLFQDFIHDLLLCDETP